MGAGLSGEGHMGAEAFRRIRKDLSIGSMPKI